MTWICPLCRQKAELPGAHPLPGNPVDIGARHEARLETHRCPNPECRETTLDVIISRQDAGDVRRWPIIPASRGRTFPTYVPAAIRADYDDACRTEAVSPRASAALARRAVQSLMRDFYAATDATLAEAIARVSGALPSGTNAATLRAIGDVANVNATVTRDPAAIVEVLAGEATLMIDLLEVLIDETYVARHRSGETLVRLQKATRADVVLGPRQAVDAPDPGAPLPRIRRLVGRALKNVSFLKYRS